MRLFRRRARRPVAAPTETTAPQGFRETLRAMREALAPLGRRRVFLVGFSVAGFAVGGVMLFSAFSFWWTSQPSFCDRCHVMNKFVDAWERSPHREVNCERCHTTPGLFGFLGGKISGLQVVMNYIRGEYEDYSFNAAVSNASCLQCHEEVLEQNLHTGESGVIVSHLNIVEMGGKCLSCHSTVAHGGVIPAGSETHPTMQSCLTCHDDETAPLRCSLCHVGREPPDQMPPDAGSATADGGST